MPAPISVVVPTLNASATLPGTLSALIEGLEAGLIAELIVSDGGSDDATCDIADEWGATIVKGPASRGGQLRRGCAAAKGRWLLIVHADTQLGAGWVGPVAAHLGTDHAAAFQLRFDKGGAWVAAWANLRARLFGLPYGDQGLLVPRALYDAVGGYQDIPLMEDVAISRALKGRMTQIEVTAITSAARYRRLGWINRGARNVWLLAQYFAGVSPARLAARYR